MRDPYRRAGLSSNPFAAESESGVDRQLWVERGLPDRLEFTPRTLVQVIGPKGAGKTSHVLHWRARLRGPYRHVAPKAGRLVSLPIARVSYWDEADRAFWLVPALLAQSVLGHMVVAGTHVDLTQLARLAGLRVVTFELPALSPDVVRRFAAQRIEAAGGEPAEWDLPYDEIASQAGSSLREAGRLLHMEKSTLSRNTDRLVAQGWLRRDGDGRSHVLRVTRKGHDLLRRALPRR